MSVPLVFDRAQLRRQRSRAANTLAQHDFLIAKAVASLTDSLSLIRHALPRLVITGARITPDQVAAITEAARADDTVLADLSPSLLARHNGLRVITDAEIWPFALQSLDAIVSVFDLHMLNDLPGALIQMQRSLKPNGVLLFAFPGGESLYQLRQSLMEADMQVYGGASPRVAPMIDKQQMAALLQRTHFALPVVDSDLIDVGYREFSSLLRDLRHMGEGNAVAARRKAFSGKAMFAAAESHYRRNFALQDGTLDAVFEIIHGIGWAPHDSQPKPLKPGSATVSLADALQTVEIGTGVKPGHD
jgi:NADH dehydrogenase [ubiquinone] 1 alpha subcomplex assembly factor 5